jgi:hypothetical protein
MGQSQQKRRAVLIVAELRSPTAALFEDELSGHHRMRKRRSRAANRRA